MKCFRCKEKDLANILIPITLIALWAFLPGSEEGREISASNVTELRRCLEGITSEPGDVCLIMPGTYNLGASEDPTLTASVKELTILSRDGADATILKGGNATIFRVVAPGVVIDGFTLSSSGPEPLILIEGEANESIQIINNIFTNKTGSYADGIRFSPEGTLKGVMISNNVFRSGKGDAIHFDRNLIGLEDVEISNNIIRSMGGAGILTEINGEVKSFTVSGRSLCEISGMGGDGLRFAPTGGLADVTLFNCTIKNNTTGLVIANGGAVERLDILSSSIKENRGWGIVVNSSDLADIRITDNRVWENLGGGLSLSSDGEAEGLNISRNILFRNGGRGILITTGNDLTDVSLAENQVSESDSTGVVCKVSGDLSGVAVDSNEIGVNLREGLFFEVKEDIIGITLMNNLISGNGHHGISLAAGGDISGADLLRNEVTGNGGIGIGLRGYDVSEIIAELNVSSENDDHGIMIEANRSAREIVIKGNKVNESDKDNDTVGTGIYIDVEEDLTGTVIQENVVEENSSGICIAAAAGRVSDINLKGNEVHDNRDQGVHIKAGRDLANVTIEDNASASNGTDLALLAGYGSAIAVRRNGLTKASQAGIFLDSTGVIITGNEVRNNNVGVLVEKASDNHINRNNIVNNRQYGVDAGGLGPDQTIDAENNWWGQPSGPSGVGPGSGDAVTTKVDFDPWLGAPAVVTGANFKITTFSVPSQVDVGKEVTITATITNTGAEEGEQDITLRIKDPGGNVVQSTTKAILLSPAGGSTITLRYSFNTAGTFTVEAITDNDSQTRTITVGGLPPSELTIEEAVAGHTGDANIIEDADILWAIGLWITQTPIPEARGAVIDDPKILELIKLWITSTPVGSS